jgi:P-type E1-E2 ATPase
VTKVDPISGESEETVLTLAASCGFGSLHPVSRAVVAEARARGIVSVPPEDVEEIPGLGVVADVNGRQALLGRRDLLAEFGIFTESINRSVDNEGDVSQVWVACDGKCLGRLILRDQPRVGARTALDRMRVLGIERLILLTGDRATVAREVGEALGVDEIVAEVLPAQKLEVVRSEQAAGRTVMMVGDGVNDALALGGADVGVAIGAELNEVAVGGADVALMGADLARLPLLVGLADITRRAISQNAFLALGLSVILMALAIRGILNPLTGALSQSATVLAVVLNSARILGFDGLQPARSIQDQTSL